MTQSHIFRLLPIIALALAWTTCPSQADEFDADAVFAKAMAVSTGGPVYLYDVQFNLDGLVTTGTVDLSAPDGQRLTVHTPPREEWSKEFENEVAQFERDVQGDIWCQDMMKDVDSYSDVTRTGDAMTYVVRMKVDPHDKDDAKFSEHVVTTITLSAGDGAVLNYSVHAPKPFRPAMVAKIKRLDVNVDCERSPDGRTYAGSMSAEVEGRALMKKFSERESRKIFNLRRL